MRVYFKMQFWEHYKNGNIGKSSNGKWVRKTDYEDLFRKYNSLKAELTLQNFNLKVAYLIENCDLRAEEKCAANIYLQTLIFFVETLIEKNKKEKANQNI